MQYKKLRLSAMLLLVLVFLAPVLATLLISNQGSPQDRQYDGIQFFVMGIYNLPFVAISLVALIAGIIFNSKSKQQSTRAALILSNFISAAGCLLMLWWALS